MRVFTQPPDQQGDYIEIDDDRKRFSPAFLSCPAIESRTFLSVRDRGTGVVCAYWCFGLMRDRFPELPRYIRLGTPLGIIAAGSEKLIRGARLEGATPTSKILLYCRAWF
jgi:hypothetical protein